MAGRGSVLPSPMTKDFSRIPAPDIQRSVFMRKPSMKTTFDAGYLVPFLVQEILPGDTVNLKAQIFARLSTMVFPIMDNVFIDTFYFFTPNRLVWDNWERFCGAQDDPADTIDYEVPYVFDTEITFGSGSLADYFGLPTGVALAEVDAPNALPFRMYNLIWNTWFRDQNLQDSVTVAKTDGPDLPTLYSLLKRGKRHDYFTSCLPWPQKGDSVAIPLGTSAPVIGTGSSMGLTDNATTTVSLAYNNDTGFNGMLGVYSGAGAGLPASPTGTRPTGDQLLGLSTSAAASGVIADLSLATAATINQLREAFATQQFLENDARGGTRYVESLKAHFGVVSPDFRLQRPEYLGGGSERVAVNAVAQTTPNATPTGLNALGVLGAYSQVGTRNGFQYSAVEHGYIIGLVNVRTDISYQQGIDRHWTRRTRFDYYWPEFAHIGEQAVLNREIYYGASPDAVFGYQERWAEYRYERAKVTGLFRANAAGSLDVWHLATNFSAQPELNAAFIADTDAATNLDRVIAVSTEPQVLFDSYIEMWHARPMPVYGVPGLKRL